MLKGFFVLKITCKNPPLCSGGIQPYVLSGTKYPVISSITSSTDAKHDPPGLVSHVPFTRLSGQCPSQKHCNVWAVMERRKINY